MLLKNIYLLFPAGYSGNYVKWAISASDADLGPLTVKNPVNTSTNKQHGGKGTSHLHTRIPTHQDIQEHLVWMAYNRPTDFKIYVIFTTSDTMSATLGGICRTDPDPCIIIIHDNSDPDVRTYGNLNAITKWPTYLHTRQNLFNFDKASQSQFDDMKNYDFFNCADDQNLRNSIAKNQFNWLISLDPLSSSTRKQYSYDIYKSKTWYQTRYQLQPHELLSSLYLIRDELPEEKIYQMSCLDIVSSNFPDLLLKILENSGCCSQFDVAPVKEVHHEYISAQENLAWFDSIKHWRQTGELDKYLTGHAVTQGFVIQEILNQLDYQKYIDFNPHDNWRDFYNTVRDPTWPDCAEECDFVTLPPRIQQELKEVFHYRFDLLQVKKNIILRELENWESMSMEEINNLFSPLLKLKNG